MLLPDPPKTLVDNIRNSLRIEGINISSPQVSLAMINAATSLPKISKLYKSASSGSWKFWNMENVLDESRIIGHKFYHQCRKDFLLLSKYISGKNLNLKGLPMGSWLKKQKFIKKCLKNTITQNNYTLYRKYTFQTKAQYNKWFNDEVTLKKTYKDDDSIILNIKEPSSWTKSKNIVTDHLFNGSGNIIVIVRLKTDKNTVFADLTLINASQKEVILKQGQYNCKIISININNNVIKPPPKSIVNALRTIANTNGMNVTNAQVSKAMMSIFNKIAVIVQSANGHNRFDNMYYSAINGNWNWGLYGESMIFDELKGKFNP